MRGGGRDEALRLAESVAQRVCHDLSGPLMGLAGALDMARQALAESERADGEPAQMLAEADLAARTLGARLRLLRAAWGGQTVPMDAAALAELATGLAGGRVRVDLSALAGRPPLPPGLARALLAALLPAGEALPDGGRVTVALPGGGELVVAIEGARAAWPRGLAAALADPDRAAAALSAAAAAGPRSLAAPLAVLVAQGCGVRLRLLLGAGGVPPVLLLTATH